MTWLGLAPIVVLLGSMFVMSFSGVAPARVEVTGRQVRVTMQGVIVEVADVEGTAAAVRAALVPAA